MRNRRGFPKHTSTSISRLFHISTDQRKLLNTSDTLLVGLDLMWGESSLLCVFLLCRSLSVSVSNMK